VVEKLAAQGVTPTGSTSEEFQKLIATEIGQWTDVVREANVQAAE
jgi:tripartite-type tricarboxylate transporter receptor subunit TctC